MAKVGIAVKLLNHEGCLIKTMVVEKSQYDPIYLAHIPRLTAYFADPQDAAFIVPRRRKFEFFDREGRFYIYKEIWE